VQASTNQLIYEAIAALATAALIYLAYSIGGFLGVGVLGVLIALIAFQADLHKAGSPHITAAAPTIEDRRDKAARHLEAASLAIPISAGKLLGLSLVVIGFGAFFLL